MNIYTLIADVMKKKDYFNGEHKFSASAIKDYLTKEEVSIQGIISTVSKDAVEQACLTNIFLTDGFKDIADAKAIYSPCFVDYALEKFAGHLYSLMDAGMIQSKLDSGELEKVFTNVKVIALQNVFHIGWQVTADINENCSLKTIRNNLKYFSDLAIKKIRENADVHGPLRVTVQTPSIDGVVTCYVTYWGDNRR